MSRIKLQTVSAESLRHELNVFESRYNVPSEQLIVAFQEDGVLRETPDFHQWSSAYAAWRMASAPNAAAAV